jgi:hypothetical protein
MNHYRSFIVLLAVFSLALFSGCQNESSVTATHPDSQLDKPDAVTEIAYSYTGHSQTGAMIVRGQLILSVRDTANLTGRWSLRALVDPNRIGPQVGTGRLTGQLRGGTLTINLNPNYVDNNVMLRGRFLRDRYAGEWTWIGFAGVLNSGTFEAVRTRTAVAERAE